MLAERRSKANYVLNPKNNCWTADDNNLGKKLMEKMGWSKGKGLGKEEQGDIEHIRVKYKNDSKGMGFAGPVDDPVLHQNDFAQLLAQLNNSQEPLPPKAELTSLEKRSESTKSRVHYKKFTRGKDLSRYSAKDLECIIGTGKKKEEPKEEKKEEIAPTEVGSTEHSYGIDTVAGGLMKDYFRKKMIEKGLWKPPVQKEEEDSEGETPRVGFGFGFKPSSVQSAEVMQPEQPNEDQSVKKEKKKKRKKEMEHSEESKPASADDGSEASSGNTDEGDVQPEADVKKKRKKCKKAKMEAEPVIVEEEIPEDRPVKTKKKKKRSAEVPVIELGDESEQDNSPEVDVHQAEAVESVNLESKKRKKKKKLQQCEEPSADDSKESMPRVEIASEAPLDDDSTQVSSKKKRSKAYQEFDVIELSDNDVAEQPKKKKAKKDKSVESSVDTTQPECEVIGEKKQKKKKSKADIC